MLNVKSCLLLHVYITIYFRSQNNLKHKLFTVKMLHAFKTTSVNTGNTNPISVQPGIFFFFLSCSTFRANSPSESMWIAMNSSSWLLCVSGCISGRGQAEGEGGRPDRALVQQMEEAYSSLSVRLPEANPEVQRLYEDWLEGEDSPCVQQTLHTHYNNHTQSPSNTPGPDIQWWSRSEKGPVYFCTSEQSFTAGKQKDPSKDQDVAMKDFLL